MQQNWIKWIQFQLFKLPQAEDHIPILRGSVFKILHFYTLPEFWEISADLPYAFVYIEFINADIFGLFLCILSSKSFCKIRIKSLFNIYKASNSSWPHFNCSFILTSILSYGLLEHLQPSPHIQLKNGLELATTLVRHYGLGQTVPTAGLGISIHQMGTTGLCWQSWQAVTKMEGKIRLPSHLVLENVCADTAND